MMKKILACVLILVLCVSVIWFANPLTPALKASADTYRSGFSIVPEREDGTGVALDSGFVLSSQSPVTLDYIQENVAMRNGEVFTVSQNADGSFLLKPSEPLRQNEVYFFDIKTQDGRTASFAFQSRRDFTVVGSLPENMTSNVPLDTGIELYFSYPDVSDISKYFEISPKVDGRFETNGYTTVFIPKELKAGTLYTVKIGKGLNAAEGAVSLNEDYVFSFETSPDEKSTADPFEGYLSFNTSNSGWFECGSAEKPAIPFELYLRDALQSADVTLAAYQFKNVDAFIKAVREKEKTPSWAPLTSSRSQLETSGLAKVLEFKQSFNLEKWQSKYMLFPQNLAEGFYLVELKSGKLTAQAFLQISDVTAYMIGDKDATLFWINNLKTGSPVKDAQVVDLTGNKKESTDAAGLVKLPKANKTGNGQLMTQDLFKVTTAEGKTSLINAGYSFDSDYKYYYRPNANGLNWIYMQTDRTLYKPTDTVEFWGFVKSRIDGKSPNKITVELSNGGYYFPMKSSFVGRFMPFLSNALETLTLKTEGGFYEGSIPLPALDPGSYTLTVKDGDEILSSSYFNVENYVKPQYKLEISSDKKAVFVGESITLTIKATFFDGTPVSNVPLHYNFNTYQGSEQGQGVTDIHGELKVAYTPQYNGNMQGECYFGFNASAQFPETGEVSGYYNFRVFANDIVFWPQGEIKDNKGTVSVTVNRVELDTLNDADTTNDDYKGDPVPNKKLGLKLWHMTWEKIETGDEYDPVNKVVRKTYEYREKKTSAGETSVVTGTDGTARYEFSIPQNEEGYYIAEITTVDSSNRSMKSETWLYNNNNPKGFPDYNEYYSLKPDKDRYKADETVSVQVVNSKQEPLKAMRTLFVESRNGIQGYRIESEPSLKEPFPGEYAPNYYLDGIVFTGKSYIQTNSIIVYNYDEKRLSLEIKTDKASYKPGDNMTISVKAADINGKPIAARVNLSMVDEALLKLSGQYIDPLAQLYSWIDSGITRTTSSRGYAEGGYGAPMTGRSYDMMDSKSKMSAEMPMPSAAPAMGKSDGNGSSYIIRSDFKDTALFKTVVLDENGTGTYTFKLPDNITSFSLNAAAVSSDLYAGSDTQSAKVSMPFFINDALSLTYLAGDKPFVGVSAYGEDLKEGEKVEFGLSIKELPSFSQTVTAKAFERINLALPVMQEGTFTLIITAKSESGKTDALSRTITVYRSYRTMEAAVLKSVSYNMRIDAGLSGLTTLIFTDAGRGSLINALHALSWDTGKRLDQKLVANTARQMLKEIVKSDDYYIDLIDINPSEYKNEDGGYGILPYAGSDLNFTAMITPLLKEFYDTTALKMYLYNAVLTEKKVPASALFALAELGEPVLLDLNRAAQTENLGLEDYIYLGLAYETLGDISSATDIYQKFVSPNLERKEQIRVKVEGNDTDTAYQQTALAAVLASRINSPDAAKLYAYVENNYSQTRYVGIERALYLKDRFKKLPDMETGFSYSFAGKDYTVDLENGRCEVIKVPSVNIDKLKISKVNGDVSVLSLFTKSFTGSTGNDAGITVTRRYFNAATGEETTTFGPDDLIRVEISYEIKKTAIDNTYEISDYAPAGLKPLDNPWNYGVRDLTGCWYRQFDGQKVTFVVGKNQEFNKPLVYYARVASPGEYTAEGTVAQGSIVKSSIVTLPNTRIIINEK